MATRNTAWQIWKWPLILNLLALVGLFAALVSDGWGDPISWLTLGIPTLVAVLPLMKIKHTDKPQR